MKNEIVIRPIGLGDAAKILEIYRPYIENTNITFEYTVPELHDWEQRIMDYKSQHPWLIAESGDKILGYAYASKHRERVAYSWCCESSVYLSEEFQGRGLASMLYTKLFEILKLQGYINVYAILTSPNPRSEKFHESFGFSDIGKFYKAGYKFNEWHNTRWMQLHLSAHQTPPGKIIPFHEIENSDSVKRILEN